MVKRVGIYSLPQGTDGDQFWEYHTKVHAADVMRAGGPALKKYVLSRVTKVISGTPQFFALIETWWESEKAAEKGFESFKTTKLSNGKTIAEDFWSRVTNGFSAQTEEVIIKES